MSAYGDNNALELPDTGDIGADLRTAMHSMVKFGAAADNAALLRALAAAAADDAQDGATLYRQITRPQHDAIVLRLQQGAARGLIRPGIDPDAVTEARIGAYLYRMLSYASADDDTTHFDGLIEALTAGITAIP